MSNFAFPCVSCLCSQYWSQEWTSTLDRWELWAVPMLKTNTATIFFGMQLTPVDDLSAMSTKDQKGHKRNWSTPLIWKSDVGLGEASEGENSLLACSNLCFRTMSFCMLIDKRYIIVGCIVSHMFHHKLPKNPKVSIKNASQLFVQCCSVHPKPPWACLLWSSALASACAQPKSVPVTAFSGHIHLCHRCANWEDG